MEPENDGFERESFSKGWFSGSMLNFWVVIFRNCMENPTKKHHIFLVAGKEFSQRPKSSMFFLKAQESSTDTADKRSTIRRNNGKSDSLRALEVAGMKKGCEKFGLLHPPERYVQPKVSF